MDEREATQKAEKILDNEEFSKEETEEIVEVLKGTFQFKFAAKVLSKLRGKDPEHIWYAQQLALSTYKDEEILPEKRFSRAIAILESIGLRDPANNNAETLALGGAIYKRTWEHKGQLEHLYEALSFYRTAYERNPDADLGYGGINAAYILQILSSRAQTVARRSKTGSKEAEDLEGQADELRKKIIDQLLPLSEKNYWIVVTLAEAYYGLGNYSEAGKWLAESKTHEVSEWEVQTTVRQLVSIARLQGIELPEENLDQSEWHEAWQTLTSIIGDDTECALTCYRGKVGLALSGGGFRASLFHLGVLARLAEMDVLRSVEIMSTVSGGSIVGAHYYLMVKQLLESKDDSEITQEDYVNLVKELQKDFLDGVQQNIRTGAFADFMENLKMIWSKDRGRSHRLGELYEEVLYSKVEDGHPQARPRYMHELLIQPKNEEEAFNPEFSNWRRRAKVPALLLNATTLNTGHNWRFTARSMGEPPGMMGGEVDKNSRYRRVYYKQAPTETLRNYRLGYAVAASACVPGLFDPLTLEDLYPEKVVRLVDGGVHDNQGVQGLLDEGCTFVLCSDASGQMDDKDEPSDGLPAVLMRSNSILMDRVRETEYQDLRARLDSRALQGLFFIHLKKDLQVCPEDWIGCRDETPDDEKEEWPTPYKVDPKIQRLLAKIRTDLDSFSDVEAFALMASGYLMSKQQLTALQEIHDKDGESGKWGGYDVDAPEQEWDFSELIPLMEVQEKPGPAREDLEKQLEAGSSRLFKVWKLDDTLQMASWILAAIAALVLVIVIKNNWEATVFSLTVKKIVLVAVIIMLPLVPAAIKKIFKRAEWLSKILEWLLARARWLFPDKAARNIGKDIFLAFFGFLAAWIHIWKFDKMFLERGNLSKLLEKKGQQKL